MTRGLEQALGLPSLEDVLRDQNVTPTITPDPTDTGLPDLDSVRSMEGMAQALSVIHDTDHGEAMDTVYDETMRHARDIADLGLQADMARAARILEVAANYFKLAVDAKNSKRDMELKEMKIAIEHQRLALAKQQAAGNAAGPTIQAEGVFYADRNEIIAQAIAARKKQPDETS